MPLTLGTTGQGHTVTLTDEQRSRHVHLIGASGSGKSKLLDNFMRQDVLAGRGFCLIDPHGTLADDVVSWCASLRLDRWRRVHVITPADLEWAVGFNPLRLDNVVEPQARVDAMVSACAQVWGGEDLASTPLLKRYLKAVFYVLAVRELTLVEAVELITLRSAQTLRRQLTRDLPDYVYGAQWDSINAMSARDFLDQFSSTNNRLMEFLSSPVVRRVVGQRKQVLDLGRAMDEGEIVIVNLASRGAISEENSQLLGTLITSELFLLAKARSQAMAKRRPFTLYVDECYQFLTGDIERMLDETRKFGLHVVLSHQRLGQLRKRSEAIYNGVMSGAQTKIVFGGMTDDDAQVMAREVFRSSFNLERPKHVLDKPVVVDEQPYWLEAESSTESGSETTGTSESSSQSVGSGSSASGSESYLGEDVDPSSRSLGIGTFENTSEAYGRSSSQSSTRGWSSTGSRSQTLKPVRVMMPTAVYSLEEELHLAMVKLRELPNRTAILKDRAHDLVEFQTPMIKVPLVRPQEVARFVERTRTASDYISPATMVEAEIAARQAGLSGKPKQASNEADPFWVDDVA